MFTRTQLMIAIVLGVLAVPLAVFAQDFQNIGASSGLGNTELPVIIGNIIRVVLGLLGVILLGLTIYAGILWMTAGGDEAKVEKAKQTMIRAVIGFAITLMAYAFVTFLMNAFGVGGLFGGDRTTSLPQIPALSNSLGNGGLVDHYPGRDQVDVPRNTRVIVTFKGVVSPEMLIEGFDDGGTPSDTSDDIVPPGSPLKTDLVSIYRTDEGVGRAFAGSNVQVGYSIIDTSTIQTSTFVFVVPLLDGEVNYSVKLDDGIRDVDGKQLIDNKGYMWSFTTSNELDVTPPQVQRVVPVPDQTYGRNVAIQVTFNEPMDPSSVSGLYLPSEGGNFDNIRVTVANGQNPIEGVYMISNGYRTVSYLTNDLCGTNSCGQSIYCLPSNSDIEALIISPEPLNVNQSPQVPPTPYPPLGVTDVVGNALDGSGNGTIEVGQDDYLLPFKTNNQIILKGPVLEGVQPDILGEEVALDAPVDLLFDDILLSASLIPGQSILFQPSPVHELWFVTRVQSSEDDKDTVHIPHGVLAESTDEQTYNYNVLALEGVRDLYQNCFVPATGPGRSSSTCTPTASQPYCCNGELSTTACITRP